MIRRARSLIETHGHDSKTALLANCASLEQEAKGAECSFPGIVRRLLEMEKLCASAAAAGDTRAVAFAIFQMYEITAPPARFAARTATQSSGETSLDSCTWRNPKPDRELLSYATQLASI